MGVRIGGLPSKLNYTHEVSDAWTDLIPPEEQANCRDRFAYLGSWSCNYFLITL